MVTKCAIIMNKRGIHLRPATEIFTAIRNFSGKVTVEKEGEEPVVIDTPFALIGLCLIQYSLVTITVEGDNEAQFSQELAELFSRHFDFA
jgi:phosphotransferase system HPr (HPr) family protein